jgi:hypothetical protein
MYNIGIKKGIMHLFFFPIFIEHVLDFRGHYVIRVFRYGRGTTENCRRANDINQCTGEFNIRITPYFLSSYPFNSASLGHIRNVQHLITWNVSLSYTCICISDKSNYCIHGLGHLSCDAPWVRFMKVIRYTCVLIDQLGEKREMCCYWPWLRFLIPEINGI